MTSAGCRRTTRPARRNTIKLDAMAAGRLRLIEAQQAILSGRAVKLLRRLRLA